MSSKILTCHSQVSSVGIPSFDPSSTHRLDCFGLAFYELHSFRRLLFISPYTQNHHFLRFSDHSLHSLDTRVSSAGKLFIMDQTFQLNFQEMQQLDSYCQSGKLDDMPLSNELLDAFGMGSYQATMPGGLPSPNSSNYDLPNSGRQSPLLPDLSTLTGGYDSEKNDGSFGAYSDDLRSQLLQQSQESSTNTGSSNSSSHHSTNQSFANASKNCSKTHVQQWEPSMTSPSLMNIRQYEDFMAPTPSEGSLCISNTPFESHAAALPSNGSLETTVERPPSTHVPIAPKGVNNTSSVSVPADLQQHSPTSESQQFEPHPSHLRHHIHPHLPQYSQFSMTAADKFTMGQVPHTESSSPKFTNTQEPNASLSHRDYQHIQPSSKRAPFRRISSGYKQSSGSKVFHIQNYQPFQESSLRTSVTSIPDPNTSEAGQFQTPHYPDPQRIFQQQANRSPYATHHHISGSQGNATMSNLPEQHQIRPSDSRDASLTSQDPRDLGFNGSSPVSIKREVSSPYSDHVVSTPNDESPLASPKSRKKRRVKQDTKSNDDSEVAIDPVALQTADLTNLSPTDHINAEALINAMHNTKNVEDNLGMQKTWEKVRRAKALRIREVCVDLLVGLNFLQSVF